MGGLRTPKPGGSEPNAAAASRPFPPGPGRNGLPESLASQLSFFWGEGWENPLPPLPVSLCAGETTDRDPLLPLPGPRSPLLMARGGFLLHRHTQRD